MFASRVTSTVQVEDPDGFVSVVVRKLSALALEKAAETRQLTVIGFSSKMGSEMIKSFRDAADEKKTEEKPAELTANEKRKARYTSYDRQTVLNKGIVSWTAAEKLCPESIEDLDEQAAQQLCEAILDLSLPAIDPAAEETKSKNV